MGPARISSGQSITIQPGKGAFEEFRSMKKHGRSQISFTHSFLLDVVANSSARSEGPWLERQAHGCGYAGIETGKTYINFNGIRPSIALEYNASLSFNRLVLDRGGNFSDPPSVVDVPAFIPELITTGTVIALPGASVRMLSGIRKSR